MKTLQKMLKQGLNTFNYELDRSLLKEIIGKKK